MGQDLEQLKFLTETVGKLTERATKAEVTLEFQNREIAQLKEEISVLKQQLEEQGQHTTVLQAKIEELEKIIRDASPTELRFENGSQNTIHTKS